MDLRTETLINAELDNELSKAEADELASRLAESDEARDYRERLRRVHDLLVTLPDEPLPDGLHRRIASSVELPAPGAAGSDAASATAWPGAVRYGLAASLGLAAGIAMFALAPSVDETDVDNLRGTIARSATSERVEVRHAAVTSHATLSHDGEFSTLDIELNSRDDIELTIELSDTGLRFAGMIPAQDRLTSLQAEPQKIRLRSHGRQRFSLVLAGESGRTSGSRSPVRLEYVHNGNSIEQRALKADQDRVSPYSKRP